MTAHRNKRDLAELITPLRERGMSIPEIGREIGLGKSQIARICSAFNIPKRAKPKPKCPHCGVALRIKSEDNFEHAGSPPQ